MTKLTRPNNTHVFKRTPRRAPIPIIINPRPKSIRRPRDFGLLSSSSMDVPSRPCMPRQHWPNMNSKEEMDYVTNTPNSCVVLVIPHEWRAQFIYYNRYDGKLFEVAITNHEGVKHVAYEPLDKPLKSESKFYKKISSKEKN